MRALERLFGSRCARIGTRTMLATLPVKALTELGFTIAFGVLLDTFIVRSVLVFDIGPRVWWPTALAREGQARHRPGEAHSGPSTDERPPERPAALTAGNTEDNPR